MFKSIIKKSLYYRFLVVVLNICFIATSLIAPNRAWAQSPADLNLPIPGNMVSLSSSYAPVLIKGLRVHPENPILFDFIVDTGNSELQTNSSELKFESNKLIKYFLASLTIPENDLWVNLSPYEKDRIIPEQLGQTEMGRDMLAEDYVLKQLTASLIYPEHNLGKEFWNKVYSKARQEYGSTQIPVNTLNKVWIMAVKAKVYVHNNTAFVVASHLKVMLEEDYLALSRHSEGARSATEESKGVLRSFANAHDDTHALASNIVRSIILPELEKEVNTGKNFSNLRQIFNSMILAAWYKKNLKESLINQVYSNKAKINGIDLQDKTIKEQIYQQYLKAYKKGVFNYIKEDSINGQMVPRKYFSGGVLGIGANVEQEVGISDPDFAMFSAKPVTGRIVEVDAATPESRVKGPDLAMVSEQPGTNEDQILVNELNQERPALYPERNLSNPQYYTSERVKENVYPHNNLGYADPELSTLNLVERKRWEEIIRARNKKLADWMRFEDGIPVFKHKTGLKGRGDLGRYGLNPAEDAVILRYNAEGKLEVLVLDRADEGGTALPGTLLYPWQDDLPPGTALTDRLYQETNVRMDMTNGIVVYSGMAGDWRDTDNARVITRGIAKILSYEESLQLNLKAKEGAKKDSVRWVSADNLQKFYARHKIIIEAAVDKVKKGVLLTTEQAEATEFGPLDISFPQILKAYQAFKEGRTEIRHSFDMVIPQAPHGGNYFVVAGIEMALNKMRSSRFSKEYIQSLRALRPRGESDRRWDEFLDVLENFQYDQGDFDAIEEGRIIQEGVPFVRFQATDLEKELISDLLKNTINQGINIATKMAQLYQAARGDFLTKEDIQRLRTQENLSLDQILKVRPVIEMALRRAQGEAANPAAVYATMGGAIGTSNEDAAKESELESMGSIAHAILQIFGPKRQKEAFRAYASIPSLKKIIFLPDTWGDTMQGIRDAIEVGLEIKKQGKQLFGLRLDSGTLDQKVELSKKAREMLDAAGLYDTKIVVTDDMDKEKITELLRRGARIDMFGVGTDLGTGGKQTTLNIDIRPSDNLRWWRSETKSGMRATVDGYITTPLGKSAYRTKYGQRQNISELLLPFWRKGERKQGIMLAQDVRERTISEIDRMTLNQKIFDTEKKLDIIHQDNPLTINPKTDITIQVDFEDAFGKRGGLPVEGAERIKPGIDEVISLFLRNHRVALLDQHEEGSVSLVDSYEGLAPFTVLTYDMVKDWTDKDNKIAEHAKFTVEELKRYLKLVPFQVLWPRHAVVTEAESQLANEDWTSKFGIILKKGLKSIVDSYGGFTDNEGKSTGLDELIHAKIPGTKRIFIAGGLAFDYCVAFTAFGAIQKGFEVYLVRDNTGSVGLPPGNIEAIEAKLKELGVKIIDSKDLLIAANRTTEGVYPARVAEEPIAHPPLIKKEKSSSLNLDTYHLIMGMALFNVGYQDLPVSFNLTVRKPPFGDKMILTGHRFLSEKFRNFTFTPKKIEQLRQDGLYSEEYLQHLAKLKLNLNIDILPDGSVVFGNEPIAKVNGPAEQALFVEDLFLNTIGFDSLNASWAREERKKLGNMVRMTENGLEGAQGPSHVEASVAFFIGGGDATTNFRAHAQYKIPLAYPGDEGIWYGAEAVTGGEKPAAGAIYKVVEVNGEPSLKVSEDPNKSTRPGRQDIFDVVDQQNQKIARMTGIEGETPVIPAGQEVRKVHFDPFMRGDEVVYKPEDIYTVRQRSLEQHDAYDHVHESPMTPGLAALQQRLIAEAREAMKPVEPTDNALIAANGGIDLNAANMSLTETGDKALIHFDNAMMVQFRRGDFSGITPVIIRIRDIGDMSPLLGLKA